MRLTLKTNGEQFRHGLAWLSFGLAIVGGLTATAAWPAAVVAAVVGIFWWWTPIALVAVVGLIVVGDVLRDGIPNRAAVYGAMVWPSLVVSVRGRLGDTMQGWVAGLNRWLDAEIAEWITDVPRGSAALMTGISVACIAFALVCTRRYGSRTKGRQPGPSRRAPADPSVQAGSEQVRSLLAGPGARDAGRR